jgi:hypothetical protein
LTLVYFPVCGGFIPKKKAIVKMSGTTDEAKANQYAAAKSHFKEHGWATIPSLLSKEKVASIVSRLWEVADIQETRGRTKFNPGLDPNSSNVRIWYQPELHSIFHDLTFQ